MIRHIEIRYRLGMITVVALLGMCLSPCSSSPLNNAVAGESVAPAAVLSAPTEAAVDWQWDEANETYWREISVWYWVNGPFHSQPTGEKPGNLDFTDSSFAMPAEADQAPAEIPLPLIDLVGEKGAELLVGATRRVYSEHGKRVSFYMLGCIAARESGGNPDARSPSGKYWDLLQIGTPHKRAMQKMGLTWGNHEDMAYYGALLYLWHGGQPWSTRYDARREYNRRGFAKLEPQK